MNKRIIAGVAGCVLALSTNAIPANAVQIKPWHVIKESNSRVALYAKWRYVDSNGEVEICATATDRKHNKKPILLTIRSVGDTATVTTSTGSNKANACLITDNYPYAIAVEGFIKDSWPYWNLMAWNRELLG